MPVDRLVMAPGVGEFGQNLRVAVNDPGIVHHFGQGDDAIQAEVGLQVRRLEPGAGGFHGGGRHAGGQAVVDVHRLAVGRGEHVIEARGPQDVGDFVGVGDDGGGAAGQDGAGEFADAGHGTFDVQVGVDKSRCHEAPTEIDGFSCRTIADGRDPPVAHGEAAGGHGAGKNVDDLGMGQQQVGRGVAPGGGDQGIQVHCGLLCKNIGRKEKHKYLISYLCVGWFLAVNPDYLRNHRGCCRLSRLSPGPFE